MATEVTDPTFDKLLQSFTEEDYEEEMHWDDEEQYWDEEEFAEPEEVYND